MRRILIGVVVSLCAITLTGCAELKQLRVENEYMKGRIDQLKNESQSCQDSLKTSQLQVQQKDLDIKSLQTAVNKKDTELKEKEVKVKEQSDSFTKMQEAMKAELASKQVALKELEGRLTLTMVESILFDSGKADVKEHGKATLDKVADVLKTAQDQDIIVAGYTDNVQIAGRLAKVYPTNWELSAARAISVVKILMAAGVDPKFLCASGFSEYRPVADNTTPEGRAKNRRMEIILMPKRK
jgi:chemotaxis protein MotB